MAREKEISETLMEIAAHHLSNGCDETCDFYRNGDCDSIPVHCLWVGLESFFRHFEQENEKKQSSSKGSRQSKTKGSRRKGV